GTPPHTAAACADRQLLFRILRSSRGATLGPCTAERHGCQLSMDRQWSIETSRRTGGARLVSFGDRSRCRTALGCPLEHVSLCRTVPRIETRGGRPVHRPPSSGRRDARRTIVHRRLSS